MTNGSPLTQNSSTALELKGSGNVKSELKTSTLTQIDTTHTGTTNFDNILIHLLLLFQTSNNICRKIS